MKNLLGAVLTLSLLIFAICCQKGSFTAINNNGNNNNNNNNNNNSNDTTSASAVGTPTGPTVSKFIGSGGGSLATADGRMEIDIPAGALANGENITIQNITNTADSATGDAYRFLPNGLKFAGPVTLKFHYSDNDVSESAPELLGIAYQDSANFWKPIQLTNLDTTLKIVSGQTTHFTDYLSFRSLRIVPISGDLIQRKKIFINKKERFQIYVAHKNNIAHLDAMLTSALADPTNWYINSVLLSSSGRYGRVTPSNTVVGSSVVEQALYTAPPAAPPDNENPVTLTAEIHIFKNDPSIKDVLSFLFNHNSNSLQYDFTLKYKIKILDYNVYRFDIVVVSYITCAAPIINVYDSASIFFRVGPDNSETYRISQDSIINLQPLASPTEGDCNKCHFTWISEPIGAVNVTSANVTYSGGASSYFVLLNWVEADENGVWYSEQCPGADAKESKPPSSSLGLAPLEIPMNINTNETQLDTLLEGTSDKSHLRLVLIRSNMN